MKAYNMRTMGRTGRLELSRACSLGARRKEPQRRGDSKEKNGGKGAQPNHLPVTDLRVTDLPLHCNSRDCSQPAKKLFGSPFFHSPIPVNWDLFRVSGFGFRISGSAGLRPSRLCGLTGLPLIACLGVMLAVLADTPIYAMVSISPEEMSEASLWVAAKFQGVVVSEPPAVGLMVLANNDPVQLNARAGRPLKIADKQFNRGLYCHAVSKVVVRLPGAGASFSAVVRVDSNEQTSGGRGSVVFSVSAGGRKGFLSQVMREGMAGVPVELPLDGAREFTLGIGDAGDGIACDQSDWADAKVVLADGRELWLGDLPMLGKAREPYSTQPPFSFRYGGQASAEFLGQWKLERETKKLDDQRAQHTLTWSDPQSGLRVRCVGVQYQDFPTVEWTVYFKNTGSADSPIIENIQAINTTISSGAPGECILRHHTGDLCTPDSYQPHADPLPAKSEKKFANTGGRPTQSAYPFYNVCWPGEGVIVVLSWAGQWATQFNRDERSEEHTSELQSPMY